MHDPEVPPSGSPRQPLSLDPGPRTPGPVLQDHRSPTTDHASADETIPFGLSWRALYGIVAATLVVLIALFSLFTGAFE
ncbi:MAG: hypothetical protein LAO05_09730 [Acidobacteriia bacterium]|nr:hypothetical protein [Terriglobia bacterium]